MAKVKTFNLTIWVNDGTSITFRGISRVAVDRYIAHYTKNENYTTWSMEERNA